MLYFEKCKCHCHTNKSVRHIMPCCYSCPRCRSNIRIGSERSHKKHCTTTKVLLSKSVQSKTNPEVTYPPDTEVFLLRELDGLWEVEVCEGDSEIKSDYLIVGPYDLKLKL